MFKKIILLIVLIFTIILTTIFISASTKSCESDDIKNNSSKISSIFNKYDSGKITLEEIEYKYPKIFEVVTISGQAFHYKFMMNVEYAKISILERPLISAVKTDKEGKWNIQLLKLRGVEHECSFILEHELYPTTQTGVINVCDSDINDVTFQMPDNDTYTNLKTQLELGISKQINSKYIIDTKNKCQVFTTLGKSWASMLYNKFPHGEADAVSIISPKISFPSLGPIYFNEDVVPDPTLTSTSVDGGVFYANIENGNYTITGNKEDVKFDTCKIKARPGILLNASPPHGIQSDQK